MGLGVSLLLQFSLTSGGYRSVGRSRRGSRRSIPRRSWKKPAPQLCSLQGRVWPLLCFQTSPQCPMLAGDKGPLGEGLLSHTLGVIPTLSLALGMRQLCAALNRL